MEVVLFNGLLSGVSISGDKFFYVNPLESGGRQGRLPTRKVPCCHGSICRTIPQVPWYLYAHTDNEVYVTLYAANRTEIPLGGGKVQIQQETAYPFDGRVVLTVSPASEGQKFNLRLRIPTWAQERFMPGALYSFVEPPPKCGTAGQRPAGPAQMGQGIYRPPRAVEIGRQGSTRPSYAGTNQYLYRQGDGLRWPGGGDAWTPGLLCRGSR